MYQYKNLLDQVSAIAKRYEKINELTGENFNVFKILKLESSEVRMHSAFIAELLNPNGTHGQKDTFLKLFVNVFCFKGNKINTESCRVEIEKHVGFISQDETTGGRIDIIITDKNNQSIIVENKIYAGDQRNQLMRYYEFSSNADIIYLTLNGRIPSDFSKGHLEEDVNYKCFSYKNDIIYWLECCRKEVAIYPIIREAITHYINLVKHLTNQTQNEAMENDVVGMIKNNFETSWIIATNLDKACQKIANDFFEDLKEEFVKNGFVCETDFNFNSRFSGIYLWQPKWQNVSIAFQFGRFDKNLIYGFLREKPETILMCEETKKRLNELPNNTGSGSLYWPWFAAIEHPYDDWSKLEPYRAIFNGDMKKLIMEKVQHLLFVTRNIDLSAK